MRSSLALLTPSELPSRQLLVKHLRVEEIEGLRQIFLGMDSTGRAARAMELPET